jgi:O2-independent ubiquinone biosynthesis protein UbiU
MSKVLELVCPAGTPAALRGAIDAGADTVYLGFRDETNARNFPGLNFDRDELREGMAYAHDQDREIFVAINTFPRPGNPEPWRQAVDDAAALGADAVILADIGLLQYCKENHPGLRRHLSVQASASNADAINFFHREFDVQRVVLPRVLTVAEIAALNAIIAVETEVFAFGGLCVMAEGRCSLSSYATGQSPNLRGVCSPASHVRYEETEDGLKSRLGTFTINMFDEDEPVGYPTLCKGRFIANSKTSYLFEEPTSLNTLDILPDLVEAGVVALKIEGRQRGKAYVEQVVTGFRQAVDALANGQTAPVINLDGLTEGQKNTAGAYDKGWR